LWRDDEIEFLKFKHGNQDTLEDYPFWRTQTAEKFLENGDALLFIYAENPDLFKDVEPHKVSIAQQAMLNTYRFHGWFWPNAC